MSDDSVLSRELNALREELSASQKAGSSQAADRAPAGDESADRATEAKGATAEQSLEGELRELVEAIKEFVEGAEKNVAAHPTATAIGAMVLGILIGRLLGRR